MKFSTFFTCASIALKYVLSKQVDYSFTTEDFKYNFYCLEGSKEICKSLKSELYQAVDSISDVIDLEPTVNFEAFVDDLSKYRVDTTKESLAVVLNNEFIPFNINNTNIISPYPNSEALLKKINKENKENDFIVVLNNFNSDKKRKNSINSYSDNWIIAEIFDALKELGKVGYPFVKTTPWEKGYAHEMLYADSFYPRRENITATYEQAEVTSRVCRDTANLDTLDTVIHWKDTLISKESNCKSQDKKSNRIVAVGDIHGDYEHFIKTLRHAKIIDRKNNWIAKDTILIQIGDLLDRGGDTKKVYELIIKLREQAQRAGGSVNVLLGNHEVWALQGNYIVTPKEDFDSFGGLENREKEFSIEGKIGSFIRKEMNVTMIIDDTLYAHAGVFPSYVDEGRNSIDKMNAYAHDILSNLPSFEEMHQLYLNNITHPVFNEYVFSGDGPMVSKLFSSLP